MHRPHRPTWDDCLDTPPYRRPRSAGTCQCGSDPASPCPVCEARMYPEDAPEEEATDDD